MKTAREYFTLSQFRFEMSVVEELQLPAYKGSTLRGAFGHAFKKVVCTLRTKECNECILKERCIYSYVFETPPPADTRMMKKYPAAPHPFVILPPAEDIRVYKTGNTFSFTLTLIGKATEYIPYFIYTFNELGTMGIGKGRGKYNLRKICTLHNGASGGEVVYRGDGKIEKKAYETMSWEEIANRLTGLNPPEVTLLFQTPTRIKYQEDLVLDLEFHMLVRSLLRRISSLSYFHCGSELDLDFRGIIRNAEKVSVKRRSLAWQDWERYSNRQETKMKMGGFLGEVTFEGEMEPFLPFLALGEYIHVGKGTSFGLGKYEICRSLQ